jgi:hypothetical protein
MVQQREDYVIHNMPHEIEPSKSAGAWRMNFVCFYTVDASSFRYHWNFDVVDSD